MPQYVPYVGDSKRAMDEYTSEIFLGGKNTIVMHNTCEDSLLAAPIILDLVILAELLTRIGAFVAPCSSTVPFVCVIVTTIQSCARMGRPSTASTLWQCCCPT